jgi:hypothetical protein
MTASSMRALRPARHPCARSWLRRRFFGRSPVTTRTAGHRCRHRQPLLARVKRRFPGAQVAWTHGGGGLPRGERTTGQLRRRRIQRHPAPSPPWALTSSVARGVAIRLRGKWAHSAHTVWPPRDTAGQLRRHVSAELLARSNRCDGGGYTSGRPVRIRQSTSFSSTLNGN